MEGKGNHLKFQTQSVPYILARIVGEDSFKQWKIYKIKYLFTESNGTSLKVH